MSSWSELVNAEVNSTASDKVMKKVVAQVLSLCDMDMYLQPPEIKSPT